MKGRTPTRRAARPLNLDDDPDILKDGGSIKVPLQMMDSRLRDPVSGMTVGGSFVDALGREDAFALHRPGYRWTKGNGHLDHLKQASEGARDERKLIAKDAWRTPSSASPALSRDEAGALAAARKRLATSTDPATARQARQMIDAAAWRDPPQIVAERFDASRRSSGSSRASDASTPAAAWPALKSKYSERMAEAETTDLQAEAEQVREERYAKDRERWRQP